MSFVVKKTFEEITQRALVSYIKELVVGSGLSKVVIECFFPLIHYNCVLIRGVGLIKEISQDLTYGGGVFWLVERIVS
jgi:hypothetical protein